MFIKRLFFKTLLAKVESVRESYPGTFYHRTLFLSTENIEGQVIEHLQSDAWPDMTAPDDTKVVWKIDHPITNQ